MGQKSNTKKSLWFPTNPLKIPRPKNFQRAREAWLYFIRSNIRREYAGTTTNLQIVLKTLKNPYLNQATTQKYLPNSPSRKKSRNQKFQTPKKSFNHPHHLKSGVPPAPLGVTGTGKWLNNFLCRPIRVYIYLTLAQMDCALLQGWEHNSS